MATSTAFTSRRARTIRRRAVVARGDRRAQGRVQRETRRERAATSQPDNRQDASSPSLAVSCSAAAGSTASRRKDDEVRTLDAALQEQVLEKQQTPYWVYYAFGLLPFALSGGAVATVAMEHAVTPICALPLAYIFFIVPALDFAVGRQLHEAFDASIAVQRGRKKSDGDEKFRGALWCVPAALSVLLLAAFGTASTFASSNIFVFLSLGMIVGGSVGGIVFSGAHELLHSNSRIDRFLAAFLLSSTCYGHWQLSHLEHHKKVGCLSDPATARKGESFYAFFFRCVIGNVIDGIEVSRQRRVLARNLFLWTAGPLAWAGISFAFAGIGGMITWGMYVIAAIVELELVNYLEHYGMERSPDERVREEHSWNGDGFFVTNATTFNLQYHSHHHRTASVKYEHLYSSETGRQLPGPYPAMMILALFPQAWRKVVHPILEEV